MTSHIVLIGPRGSGKTTVGQYLADQFGRAFVDLDDLVVKSAGRSIATLFKAEGEKRFRDREQVALATTLTRPALVIATGGGVVVREGNRALLKSDRVHCVLLLAGEDELARRVEADTTSREMRPNLSAGNALSDRIAWYREIASATIETDGKTPDQVATLVLQSIENA